MKKTNFSNVQLTEILVGLGGIYCSNEGLVYLRKQNIPLIWLIDLFIRLLLFINSELLKVLLTLIYKKKVVNDPVGVSHN